MVPDDLHDFFVAAAGVAGALIGLLFVAISVVGDKLTSHDDGPLHRVRAAAALTAFTNALVVALFALVPGDLADAALTIAVVGLVFVGAALLSLRRLRGFEWRMLWDLAFLAGLVAVFVQQLLAGIRLHGGEQVHSTVATLATLVVICFLIGIARAWQLIGGPSIGFAGEAVGLSREVLSRRSVDEPDDGR